MALELILGLTGSQEMLPYLKEANTPKVILREMETSDISPDEAQIGYQILVNLSSEESFINEFLLINAAYRCGRLFLSKIDKEIKVKPVDDNMFTLDLDLCLLGEGVQLTDNSFSSQYEIKKSKYISIFYLSVMDNYILSSKTQDKNIASEDIATIPYLLMIITNLTTVEEGQKQFFNLENEQLRGILFLKMLDKYFQHIYRDEMDFFSSIIANISSLKEGRVFMLENKVFEIILGQFDKLNNMKMTNMLRVFRNCCFEFEAFEEQLVCKDGIMLLYAFKILVETNLKNELKYLDIKSLDEIYFTHFDKSRASEEKEAINDLIIDIFVVLTNTETAFPIVVKKGLKAAWDKVKVKIIDKTLEDRLFVVDNFLSSHI